MRYLFIAVFSVIFLSVIGSKSFALHKFNELNPPENIECLLGVYHDIDVIELLWEANIASNKYVINLECVDPVTDELTASLSFSTADCDIFMGEGECSSLDISEIIPQSLLEDLGADMDNDTCFFRVRSIRTNRAGKASGNNGAKNNKWSDAVECTD